MDDLFSHEPQQYAPDRLKTQLATSGFAFRGFDQTNLGKTPELLAHVLYGPIVEKHLAEASAICSRVLDQRVDLVARVRERSEPTLDEYGEAIALIISVEMAQLELLRHFFGIDYSASQLSIGYSLGEVGALVASGVYGMESVLTPLLSLSADMVSQAPDTRMGIVFSRGPDLDVTAVQRLCLEITNHGHGTIAISSYLAPNTVLVIGQYGTIDELKVHVKARFPKGVNLKIDQHTWPPIHTPITRQKSIPDRAAVLMERMPGGFAAPKPPILSCVTGDSGYDEINSRDILNRWVDEPQRLWDVMDKTIASGVELLIHVGPAPNIIPATLQRISQNVQMQLAQKSWSSLGLRAISGLMRSRPWLANMLARKTSLLRAPFIQEIVLEDWLLSQMP